MRSQHGYFLSLQKAIARPISLKVRSPDLIQRKNAIAISNVFKKIIVRTVIRKAIALPTW